MNELIASLQNNNRLLSLANYHVAELYAFRGETDKAFEFLDKAYSIKNPYLTTIKIDPLLKNITSDPRYTALLKKMNLPLD